MKLPLLWLKDYVDIDCSVDELVKKLFSCGFEVEEIINIGENINRIVTCKINKIEQHPNADKLSVCQVNAGDFGNLQIITSAKNISEGDVVPVALDNSTLANGEKIKNGNLRGVLSQGMFCSGEELGINDDWYPGASVNGILILDNNFPLGVEVADLLEIKTTVLDINVTANRHDCQSILGLAREVAVAINKPLKMPNLHYEANQKVSTKNIINVTNKAFDLCQKYKAHLVENVKLEKSPLWLTRKLSLMGLRSINNIVDITNYVLLEIGQPMHAFDLSNISGNKIIVRRAENGEEITTLDDKKFNLTQNNLVICDGERPIALAGIMGGLNSEIKSTTKNIVFESAKFSRDNIRKTSRALGQKSDSSARYEKGVDYYTTDLGMQRALNLIYQLKAGEIAVDEYDLIEAEPKNTIINTKISKILGVLGIEIDTNYIEDILTKLHFGVKISGDDVEITVPLFRDDVESYQDIAEELIRQYGYDHLTPTLLKNCSITNGGFNYEQEKIEKLKDLLVSYGFNEAITYSFVNPKDFDGFYLLNDENKDKIIKILNPISEEMSVMRLSVLPSLIKSAIYNINRKNLDGRLFELAKTYLSNDAEMKGLPTENLKLSFVAFGEEDFYTVKGVIEGILEEFCAGKDIQYVKSNSKIFHPTRCADIKIFNNIIGSFGQINPEIITNLGVDKQIFGCEIDFNLLFKEFEDKIIYQPISKFPIIERDLAVLVNDEVTWEQINNVVKQNAGKYLTTIKLFDIYKGEQIASDKKSVAFNMIFVSHDRTLEVEEIDRAIKKILKGLSENLGAELR